MSIYEKKDDINYMKLNRIVKESLEEIEKTPILRNNLYYFGEFVKIK